MRESKVEAHLVKRVKALGGETRKVAWIGRRHAPDRFVMLGRGSKPNFWCECKRPGLDATEGQAREHARMTALGEIVVVLDTIEAIDRYLDA